MRASTGVLAGVVGTLAAGLTIQWVIDPKGREEIIEAGATIVAAAPVLALVPFRSYGARRMEPEALARFVRSHYLEDGKPALRLWVFALSDRLGLIWLRGDDKAARAGRRVAWGRTPDFHPAIKVSDIFGHESDGDGV